MRLLSPSTTLTLTSTVSPGAKSGMVLPAASFSTCSLSICWMMFMAYLSVCSASNRRAVLSGLNGLRELLRQSSQLVTHAFWARFGAFYGPDRPVSYTHLRAHETVLDL